MPNFEKLAEIAKESGFSHYAPLDVSTLEFMKEIRDMCNAKQCNRYNKSWSCPPACASLEEIRELAKNYTSGIIVQTVGDVEDSFDWDEIMETGALHKKNFGQMRVLLGEKYSNILAMGAGECKICELCTYPNKPCRYPKKKEVSMEACGLNVSKVCADNGMQYNYGSDKIAFTSCFLVE